MTARSGRTSTEANGALKVARHATLANCLSPTDDGAGTGRMAMFVAGKWRTKMTILLRVPEFGCFRSSEELAQTLLSYMHL